MKDEYIADYIDEMCRLASGLQPRMEEGQIVRVIVDNSNLSCKIHLATRVFSSIEMLRHHANYLGAAGLVPLPIPEKKPMINRTFFKPRAIHATEIEDDTPSESKLEEEGAKEEMGDENEREWFIDSIMKAWQNRKINNKNHGNRKETIKPIKPVEPENVEVMKKAMSLAEFALEIRCYGCNAPGVIKRNCATCNSQKPKNGSAAL